MITPREFEIIAGSIAGLIIGGSVSWLTWTLGHRRGYLAGYAAGLKGVVAGIAEKEQAGIFKRGYDKGTEETNQKYHDLVKDGKIIVERTLTCPECGKTARFGQYEYLVFDTQGRQTTAVFGQFRLVDGLNSLGSEGWALAAITPAFLVFCRVKEWAIEAP